MSYTWHDINRDTRASRFFECAVLCVRLVAARGQQKSNAIKAKSHLSRTCVVGFTHTHTQVS